MKRFSAFIIVCCLLLAVTACGSKYEQNEPRDTSAPSPSAPLEEDPGQSPDREAPLEPEAQPPEIEEQTEPTQRQTYELTQHIDRNSSDDGYSWEWTMEIGQWVKATDTEAIEDAWKRVGGTGNAPTVKSFFNSANITSPENTIMLFGSISFKDTTPGQFSIADAGKVVGVFPVNANTDSKLKVQRDIRVYYSNTSVQAWNSSGGKPLSSVQVCPKITQRTCGPIPFVVCVGGNVFAPSFPDGNPIIFDAPWYFGGDEFYILPSWDCNQ